MASLYLFYKRRFDTFEEALNFVKSRRGLANDANKPQKYLIDLAKKLIEAFPKLFD